jgi:hypothetical protein
MTEVPLSSLKQWYEENVARTSTLEIIRCMYQGNFPGAPTSLLFSERQDLQLFELRRAELGDAEFRLYLQCQMACWKEYHKDKPFPLPYAVGDKAGERYLERRERLVHSGFHFFGSEIYRAVFPCECEALHEYFRRWLRYDGKEEEEPNWPELKTSYAARSHPFWTFFSCNHEKAASRGAEFYSVWIAGKKRAKARLLMRDSNEYDRAVIDALVLTANQFTPLARGFSIIPEADFSFPYQIAVQIYDLRKEIVSSSPPLRISIGDGNEKIDGLLPT